MVSFILSAVLMVMLGFIIENGAEFIADYIVNNERSSTLVKVLRGLLLLCTVVYACITLIIYFTTL